MSEDQKTDTDEVNPAVPPESKEPKLPSNKAGSRLDRFKNWYRDRRKWTIPASVLLFILLLFAAPFTRYGLAGMVIKRDMTIEVMDANSHTPVSGAAVSLNLQSAITDGNGRATLHKVKTGKYQVLLSKKYYKDRTINVLSPVFGSPKIQSADLTATGRQVKIVVTNSVNKSVLTDVTIKVAGTTAKTDKKGTALVVLPAVGNEQTANLSANGYNDANVSVKVSNSKVQENKFTLTPAGKIYFLSKLSGKIDVVKTNLDGSDRKTVLAGTGREDDRNTVLLSTRDWKYLALLSRRAGNNPSLYLIDTSNDSNSVIDEGSVEFNLVGWANDNFIYTVNRGNVPLWQNGHQVLKSFDAKTKKGIALDQTTASGTSNYDYVGEQLGIAYAYEDLVFYIKNWSSAYGGNSVENKQATFNSVKPDGSGKKAIRSFAPTAGAYTTYTSLDARVKSPDVIALHFNDGNKDSFYVYANGQVKDDPSGSNDTFFSGSYPTYLLSPSGSRTFWSEPRDGKNTLFVGSEDGKDSKQIAALSDYNTFGWFSDDYLLVSKNNSELYVMDNEAKQTAVKISDYHKPALTFQGYGGGYGGL